MTEVFFRNPDNYTREIQEADVRLISWDIGHLRKRSIDPLSYASIYLGQTRPWRMLVVAFEGTAEYNETSVDINEPAAVYPSWRKHYGWDRLIDYCKNPVGEDLKLCNSRNIEGRFRPVYGQPHKVLIYDAPTTTSYESIRYLRELLSVAEDFPDVQFIIHDTASFRVMFALNFEAAIFEPNLVAKNKSIILPTGTKIKESEFAEHRSWINALGFNGRELRGYEGKGMRCLYNIEAIRWAQVNYKKNVNFRIAVEKKIDIDSPGGAYEINNETTLWVTSLSKSSMMQPGDGMLCNKCSIARICKYFREGLVCGVPKSEVNPLVKHFGTRDAGVIVDGLVELTEIQAERVAKDLADEKRTGERYEVTDKRIKNLFDTGVKVAKLIDPTLNGKGTTVNVGVLGGSAIVQQQTPQELMARAVQALERSGIPREEITPQMIKGLLEGVANPSAIHSAIEAEMIEVEADEI